jgi:hypothetical protein
MKSMKEFPQQEEGLMKVPFVCIRTQYISIPKWKHYGEACWLHPYENPSSQKTAMFTSVAVRTSNNARMGVRM